MKWLYERPLLERKTRKKCERACFYEVFTPLYEEMFDNNSNRLVNIAYFVLNLTKTVFN